MDRPKPSFAVNAELEASPRGCRRRTRGAIVIFILAALTFAPRAWLRADQPSSMTVQVHALTIILLSTMLADGEELGEWGFSALVEVDGHRFLFDTGAHPDVVLKNAQSLRVDLTTVTDVVLSHSHSDHVGGLVALRRNLREQNSSALSRVHVSEGIFYPRWSIRPEVEENPMIEIKSAYEKTGGVFISHDKPVSLFPGVWLTGPIPRNHPERNWSGNGKVVTPAGTIEDSLPEDTALVFDTDQGLVVLCGCGHAGVINTIEFARSIVRPARIHALIGGIHLFSAKDATVTWTAEQMTAIGLDYFVGAHCTGIEPVYRFRRDIGLDRQHAVVGAVGAKFELGQGISPRNIAR